MGRTQTRKNEDFLSAGGNQNFRQVRAAATLDFHPVAKSLPESHSRLNPRSSRTRCPCSGQEMVLTRRVSKSISEWLPNEVIPEVIEATPSSSQAALCRTCILFHSLSRHPNFVLYGSPPRLRFHHAFLFHDSRPPFQVCRAGAVAHCQPRT
jgi:hypothetical protein